jgi:hypothetical protein
MKKKEKPARKTIRAILARDTRQTRLATVTNSQKSVT